MMMTATPKATTSWRDALAKASTEDRDRVRGFYWTQKTGTHIATGLPSFELESSTTPGFRLWILEDGRVVED
jgi:hypothetical protein